jgi:hypothetical protein
MSLFRLQGEKKDEYPVPTGTYRRRIYEQTQQSQPETTPTGSFGGRFLLCILLLCCYLFLSVEQKETIDNYVKADYSKNVFDFITELSYTLDYEKTSIK